MSKEEIFKVVVEVLQADLEKKVEITYKTNPFADLGKDSHDGVVVACLLSERLGIEIPDDANPLVDDEQQRPRLVEEIVDFCFEVYIKNGVTHVSK
jgi:acyl carrier protein